MANSWIQALKIWNAKNEGKYQIPRKPKAGEEASQAYKEVRSIMESLGSPTLKITEVTDVTEVAAPIVESKRAVGRPKKTVAMSEDGVVKAKRAVGRPKKAAVVSEDAVVVKAKRGPGRPKKVTDVSVIQIDKKSKKQIIALPELPTTVTFVNESKDEVLKEPIVSVPKVKVAKAVKEPKVKAVKEPKVKAVKEPKVKAVKEPKVKAVKAVKEKAVVDEAKESKADKKSKTMISRVLSLKSPFMASPEDKDFFTIVVRKPLQMLFDLSDELVESLKAEKSFNLNLKSYGQSDSAKEDGLVDSVNIKDGKIYVTLKVFISEYQQSIYIQLEYDPEAKDKNYIRVVDVIAVGALIDDATKKVIKDAIEKKANKLAIAEADYQ